ncbi:MULTISPECIES: hypothetical protein [Nitrosospira]|uniref:hypothetical protein n=1 Tax=Nitrosospira TaxID=35798 RepID=UPI00115FE355|nr:MULTISPECIES: hypothetical protein [Nitrosospira]
MRSASKTGLAASLIYDGLGRMRQTTIAGTTTKLLYDGTDLVAESSKRPGRRGARYFCKPLL